VVQEISSDRVADVAGRAEDERVPRGLGQTESSFSRVAAFL
jgi:hypothetical protein